jgi:hypothetical protein
VRPLPEAAAVLLVVDRLAAAGGVEAWEAFMALDDILDELAADADERLAYQASHPIRRDL